MEITLLKIRRVSTNSDPELRAVCDIQLVFAPNQWIVIREFKVIEKNGETKVKIPGRKWVTQKGVLVHAKAVSLPNEIMSKIESLIMDAYNAPNYLSEKEMFGGNETK
jgi:DNA-binding cell septation regulator SpoVG